MVSFLTQVRMAVTHSGPAYRRPSRSQDSIHNTSGIDRISNKGGAMSTNLQAAMDARLLHGEKPTQIFEGLSAGLNARANSNQTRARMYVLPGAVIVGYHKGLIVSRPVVERFAASDLMEVHDGREPVTGIAGAINRKNASTAAGRAMGASGTTPSVTLVTRRGDLVFAFKQREAGRAREASVAINELVK